MIDPRARSIVASEDPLDERIDVAVAALQARRFRFGHETELQEELQAALAAEGMSFAREVRLSPRDRIDLLEDDPAPLGGAIGIEVKVDSSIFAIAQQVARYAEHARIGAIVLVTSQLQHTQARGAQLVNGKPFRLVYVGGASF